MELRKNKSKFVGALLLSSMFLIISCSNSNEESVKQLGENSRNKTVDIQQDVELEEENNSAESPNSTGVVDDLDGRPSHRIEPEEVPPPEISSRPANMSSQRWWIEGDVMRWWFGTQTDYSISPEMWIKIWADPSNSDVGSPEIAADLAGAAEGNALQWLSNPTTEGTRGVLSPAAGVSIQGISTAKANRADGGPQLYRAAILWSADEDPEFRKPVFNQILEMYFVGTPGNWTWVKCADIDPQLCVPIFQKII